MSFKQKTNIINLIEDRRIYHKSNKRRNDYIARRLICQSSSKFTRTWEKHSKFPISYEDGRLFFENYRMSYSTNGLGFKPALMFKLGRTPATQKVEDAVVSQFPLEFIPTHNKGWRPCLLTVTQDNYLKRFDLDTGSALEEVFLSHRYKYRHLSWNNQGHSIVLKSTLVKSTLGRNQLSQISREAPNVLLAFAIFDLYPLKFVGMFEITRKIFGKDIIDAMISEGMLLIMHPNHLLKLYNLETTLEESVKIHAEIGKTCNEMEWGSVGSGLVGLPLNANITKRPTVLFEVKCHQHSLIMGGLPWHYIISPPGKQGQFHVYSVDNNQLAQNGRLDMKNLSVEPDKCLFHMDDSGRIIHIGAKEVRVLRFEEKLCDSGSAYSLLEDFIIDSDRLCPTVETPLHHLIGMTSSGRRVRQMKSYAEDSVQCDMEAIQLVDYDEDLDLMLVTAVHKNGDKYKGTVYLHDNVTGQLLKEIPLDEPWIEFCTHNVYLEMDKLIHQVSGPNRKFSCYVHQLDLKPKDINEGQESKRKQKRKGNTEVTNRRLGRRRTRINYNEDDYG